MRGYLDETLTPRVEVTLFDIEKIGKDFSCVIDTGFTEEIYLPVKFAEELNLEISGVEPIMLADGSITKVSIAPIFLRWCGKTREVIALIGGGKDILIGIKLLSDYELKINFTKGVVELL
ncbi:MAG: clan AA aspartic protease [bacterium]